jgi:S-adenosylmethionine/arginine decarboxylase-like enzyme
MNEYKTTIANDIKYYGKHLIVNAIKCNENILQIDLISKFIQEMIPKIDMVPYGDLIIARFGDGINVGISAVQLIYTSSIVIHTNDMARDMYLDVFSCKWFSEDIVLQDLRELFCPQLVNETILLRR